MFTSLVLLQNDDLLNPTLGLFHIFNSVDVLVQNYLSSILVPLREMLNYFLGYGVRPKSLANCNKQSPKYPESPSEG